MAAQRSLGVTLSAIVSIAGSALVALFAALMLVTAITQQPQPTQPGWLKLGEYIFCLFIAALAAWGITTAVGLFRLRHWSRISILIFSGLLAIFGPLSAVTFALAPLPETPGAPSGFVPIVRAIVISFYAVMTLLGVCWLIYFTRPSVRLQLGAEESRPGSRPLSISIIGWLFIAGALFSVLSAALFPVPSPLLGLILRGWPARLLACAYAALSLWIGVGLLRLNPVSRLVAIGYCLFAITNSALFIALPDYQGRMKAPLEATSGTFHQPNMDSLVTMSPATDMIAGAIACIVPIWFLVARRAAFRNDTPSAAS
jgi:hypothetical protein